jgi:hypothetical protein
VNLGLLSVPIRYRINVYGVNGRTILTGGRKMAVLREELSQPKKFVLKLVVVFFLKFIDSIVVISHETGDISRNR